MTVTGITTTGRRERRACFLPIQSGVGDIANAVLGALGKHPDIPAFEMYTEVLQDSVIRPMKSERVKFGSDLAAGRHLGEHRD